MPAPAYIPTSNFLNSEDCFLDFFKNVMPVKLFIPQINYDVFNCIQMNGNNLSAVSF